MAEDTQLTKVTQARIMLQQARDMGDIKHVHDLAEMCRIYAKQVGESLTVQNEAAMLKIDAERKGGDLLKVMKEEGQLRTQGDTTSQRGKSSYQDVGLGKHQSSRWQQLATLPDETVQLYYTEQQTAGDEITQADMLRLAKRIDRDEALNALRNQTAPPPLGTYRTLVIDPPWPISKIERDVRPNQVRFDYPTMSIDELAAWDLPHDVADEAAHCYLWTTHKFLPDALHMLDLWDFQYQCVLTWVKNVGFTPFSWMYSTELVLFSHKGALPLLELGRRLDLYADVREHSRKPAAFYALVADVSPGPRLDMFAREAHEGFDVWGIEKERFDAVAD